MIHKFLVTQTVTMIAVTIVQVLYCMGSAQEYLIQCVLSVSQGTLHSVSPSRPLD